MRHDPIADPAPARPAMAARTTPKARLLLSVHDVAPCFESEVDQLTERLMRITGGAKLAMLVVPDHWARANIRSAPGFQARLRGWADAGMEMFVHGWFHKDAAIYRGGAALKARYMTAGEGEFLSLDRQEAARRMSDGKALVEDITGRSAAGFIAPAWLYSLGARAALADCGFALAEDHFRVWQPGRNDRALARGPVITWASRSKARALSSLGFAALARHSLHGLRTVRIGVHPGDVGRPELVASIEATVGAFAARRPSGRYADLLN